jgi:antitoxin ParD1/3/4
MAIRMTLNISLPPKLGQFVEQRVASGRYSSASEVIRAGLRLLEEREGQGVPSVVADHHKGNSAKSPRSSRRS